jgi:NADH-quinone oxidoreductase subunit H
MHTPSSAVGEQAPLGPMHVGSQGLSQSVAEALKLLIKEDVVPHNANKTIFWLAPIMSVSAAIIAMGALAFGPSFQVARDINVGILFVLGVSSLGLFGIILGGWASNSDSSLLGAMRSAAQLISYETAAGLAVVSALLLSGSLRIRAIVESQREFGVWFVFVAPVAFLIYFVAPIAETNRAPFNPIEAKSELAAGYRTEFYGFRWSLYFLAECANMIVFGSVATTLFLGGWLRPFPSVHGLDCLDFMPSLLLFVVSVYCVYRARKQTVRIQSLFLAVVALACLALAALLGAPLLFASLKSLQPGLHGAFWFLLKVGGYLYTFRCLRFALSHYRSDQFMRLEWYFLIPLALVNVLSVGSAMMLELDFGWNRWLAVALMLFITLVAALCLLFLKDKRASAANAVAVVHRDPHAG